MYMINLRFGPGTAARAIVSLGITGMFICLGLEPEAAVATVHRPLASEPLLRAHTSVLALIKDYWDPKLGVFKNRYPINTPSSNYWWQANAMDALSQDVRLGIREPCASIIGEMYQSIIVRGSLTTQFNDDRNWMGLALLDAYRATGESRYLSAAQLLFNQVYTSGWQPQGGIVWNSIGSSYRNTPANAPAAILGATLYLVTRNSADLRAAKRIFSWQWSHLVGRSGTVWDGVQGSTVETDQYSYNYGVVIGAALRLWAATHQSSYLKDATLVTTRSITEFTWLNTDLVESEGQGDGGLFDGIYVRYLGLMARFGSIRERQYFDHVIQVNADNAWLYDRTAQGLFADDWTSQLNLASADSVDLSTAVSGVFLMNEWAALKDPLIYERR